MEAANGVCRNAGTVKGVQNMKKKRIPIYWIALAVYTLLLLAGGLAFLEYTDKSLQQYENAQPEAAMARYLEEFKKMAKDGVLCDNIDMPAVPNAFETAEDYRAFYQDRLEGISAYAFVKDEGNYSAQAPSYMIYGDQEPVAKVILSPSHERTLLGILTVVDWETAAVAPVFGRDLQDYAIRIPDNYSATVNDIPLSAEYLTGERVENPEFANVSAYVQMPANVEYALSGLLEKPEIKIFNAQGGEAAFAWDEETNVAMAEQEPVPMPENYYQEALLMAQAWENFLTGDLPGERHGLAAIRRYLLQDSYYWKMADDYAKSEDITFISAHTMGNPPYSNVKISNYIPYGENCYSCHIYFEKNMILKSGSRRVDTIDSTFYFVKYDDSDDGTDNPHWAIADMTAAVGDGR